MVSVIPAVIAQKLPLPQKKDTARVCGISPTGSFLSSRAASGQVLSTFEGLTAVFGMGTGGPPQLSPPDLLLRYTLKTSTEETFLSQALDILVSVR